ncbi:TetR family transcriptional regulator [Pseudomonas syringae]|uniref:TetR family transcriptional regulator n=1 Tax=Pseudomonas syringae TaxID=317 RepID=UPI0013724837|nr:TetR family transcriptional regulator [Pseudomonas syringae pv. actinidifoliorum]NAT25504.1 TetR family transcriptional regulator [Pseudomonas syringae pv. actinidifoliorum]NAT37991.1 TetR family transcriptional regulator [Pseudomonas syringae pv. actinidifoliorum]NAT63131.1 TetR family transcriptional regulator [Pseudomonas syringae pv. actinidifoliorum]
MSDNAREAILAAAKSAAQQHGYSGINFRHIADEVGIKTASIYYHFPSKARLGAGVAERYWQDTQSVLNDMRSANADPKECLRLYPWIFRKSLEDDNRLCLSSFMAAEVEDLPDEVLREVMAFADINVAWLAEVLRCAATVPQAECERRARAIYAAVAGAQLIARTQADISVFDDLVASYHEAGLIPD